MRLTLLAFVIFLQNLLEFDRRGLRRALGAPLTSALVFLILGGSLALLFYALRPQAPRWRWPRSHAVQTVALALTLAGCIVGAHQVVAMTTATFQPPNYPNDGTTLDHYAAQQLVAGHNPYTSSNIVAAIRALHQQPTHTTPLGRGAFAADYPTRYPSQAEITRVFLQEPIGQPGRVVEFESRVSYPSLSFLPLVPLVWLGAPSVVGFFALCYVALVVVLVSAVPASLRIWVALLALADTPLLNATVGGVLDVFYMTLIVVAWRWRGRAILSTVFLGLAISAKQLAWFFLPFYAIIVWREHGWRTGWRAAAARLGGAGGVFALCNGPFIVADPHAWLAGVLAPEVDRMFPLGNGLVSLSTSGLLPLPPSSVYTALWALAIVASVAWYWWASHTGRATPELALLLAVAPLFFAWRSLTTYFYFVALAAVALVVARQAIAPHAPAGAARTPVTMPTNLRRPSRLRGRRG